MKDRGGPTGLYNSGGSIGPAIAPPLLTVLMLTFGWRTMMFITMGVAGSVRRPGVVLNYTAIRTRRRWSTLDEAYLAENRAATTKVEARHWGRLFRFGRPGR